MQKLDQRITKSLPPAWPEIRQDAPDMSPPIARYARVLWKRRWLVLGIFALGMTGVYFISKQARPLYEATALVEVDRHMPDGVIGSRSQTTGFSPDDDQYMSTQMRLVQSDAVVRPVALKFNLLQDEGQTAQSADAPIELKQLKVTRPPNTQLLQIRYRSSDPKVAAEVSNSIANAYVESSYNLRVQSSARMASFMDAQIEALKEKMNRSSLALAQFEKELNIVNPKEKTNLLGDRLVQLNTEFTNVQAERLRREAAYNLLKESSLDVVQASSLSEPLKKLVERRNELADKFSQLKQYYGANHPEYRKQAAQISELDAQIEATRLSITKRVEAQFNEAKDHEEMLRQALAKAKEESDDVNRRSFEYDRLKQEADSDKRLYEELARKVKEASINSSFRSDSIRIADLARPAGEPVSPNLKLALMVGGVLFFLLGTGTAVVAEKLNRSVHNVQQARATFGVPILGSLPTVVRNRAARGRLRLTAGEPSLFADVNNSKMADNYGGCVRSIRNAISLSTRGSRLQSVLITSSLSGEGKTNTAAHLAIANALTGRRTLLIDGDLRRPCVHRLLNIPNEAGVAEFIGGNPAWRTSLQRSPNVPELDVLTAGNANARVFDLLGDRIQELLEQACLEYDLVVLDSPPLLGIPETLQMATAADGVVLITLAGKTDSAAVLSTLASLAQVRARLVGVVLNQVESDQTDISYYGARPSLADRGN